MFQDAVETNVHESDKSFENRMWDNIFPITIAETETLQDCIVFYTTSDHLIQKKNAPEHFVVLVILPFPNWVRLNIYSRGKVF